MHESITIIGYKDADIAAAKAYSKSITGGWINVDGIPVACLAKNQVEVSLSTMKAEFTVASVVVTHMLGLRELFGEIEMPCNEPMLIYVDNQAVISKLGGDGASARSKHIDVRIKFVS